MEPSGAADRAGHLRVGPGLARGSAALVTTVGQACQPRALNRRHSDGGRPNGGPKLETRERLRKTGTKQAGDAHRTEVANDPMVGTVLATPAPRKRKWRKRTRSSGIIASSKTKCANADRAVRTLRKSAADFRPVLNPLALGVEKDSDHIVRAHWQSLALIKTGRAKRLRGSEPKPPPKSRPRVKLGARTLDWELSP